MFFQVHSVVVVGPKCPVVPAKFAGPIHFGFVDAVVSVVGVAVVVAGDVAATGPSPLTHILVYANSSQ